MHAEHARSQGYPVDPRRPCDLARDIATTDAYLVSRRQRKKVEMLFVHLKRILKLDRMRLSGPNGARDEFHLAAAAQNLRNLAKLSPQADARYRLTGSGTALACYPYRSSIAAETDFLNRIGPRTVIRVLTIVDRNPPSSVNVGPGGDRSATDPASVAVKLTSVKHTRHSSGPKPRLDR